MLPPSCLYSIQPSTKATAMHTRILFTTSILFLFALTTFSQKKNTSPPSKADALKKEVMTAIDGKKKDAQVMVDKVFSFAELGFQEKETSAYLTGILEKNGFTIQRGIA